MPGDNLRVTRHLIDAPPLGLYGLAEELQAQLPVAAEHAVQAIISEVPTYRGALSGRRAARIAGAVQFALTGFIDTATRSGDRADQVRSVLDGAYALGRDEARSGRSMDALLAAYRVGARVAWRELAAIAVGHGADADVVARFAALVFAYIDELSAASVAGHSDELTASELDRRRHRERLAHRLLVSDPVDALTAAAERAGWTPPTTLTVVLVPVAEARRVRQRLDGATLQAGDETAEALLDRDTAILLVPDADGPGRSRLLRLVEPGSAQVTVVGPAKPWAQVSASLARAVRARRLAGATATTDQPRVVDTEAHLVRLVVGADPDGLADLRVSVFSKLADLPPATRERLLETLRSWLLHQGRREAVAAQLFVHPQTVRYRMSQLRELLGADLDDPLWCEAAVIALSSSYS